ncbi:hypothetical protein K432DRAFT_403563 [Lepidopterella palustris CBS 459.81]|uniref:Uncharacterized protein n=1 Tax=Lepidopterella palustris CBS 459.81 TaxID=1314670 RepID=A0A8E2ED06_9PEZI|nr:hypothetical protein K432DRAFT_403563 [Lepidopterella palustris CBS 459.81]
MVGKGEKFKGKIVRMLKGALTPHINNYSLEIKYQDDAVDRVADSLKVQFTLEEKKPSERNPLMNKPISLHDLDAQESLEGVQDTSLDLPKTTPPKLLQTPCKIPPLFAFNGTSVYILVSPETSEMTPTFVILRQTLSKALWNWRSSSRFLRRQAKQISNSPPGRPRRNLKRAKAGPAKLKTIKAC